MAEKSLNPFYQSECSFKSYYPIWLFYSKICSCHQLLVSVWWTILNVFDVALICLFHANFKSTCLMFNAIRYAQNLNCFKVIKGQINVPYAMVVAQLVEQSLPKPEVCSLNPVISKIYIEQCLLYWKDENKEKRDRERPFFM